MTMSDRSMALGLRALNQLAGLAVIDRLGLRKPAERLIFTTSRNGFRAAGAAGRTFTATTRLGRPARLSPAPSRGLFDLTLDDEQELLRDTFAEFGRARLRPAAQAADAACEAPAALLAQAA